MFVFLLLFALTAIDVCCTVVSFTKLVILDGMQTNIFVEIQKKYSSKHREKFTGQICESFDHNFVTGFTQNINGLCSACGKKSCKKINEKQNYIKA